MFDDLLTALASAHPLTLAASVALLLFAGLSALDGLYIHLWRLRLHARDDSRGEHLFHTARALLFVPILATVFTADTGSLVFWTGIALVAADQIAELLDMWSERASRATIGGLGSGEYVLHVALTTVRTTAVALALAVRAPHLGTLAPPEAGLGLLSALAELLVPGAIAVALLHLALAVPATRALVDRRLAA
jgi:hypothetical protein